MSGIQESAVDSSQEMPAVPPDTKTAPENASSEAVAASASVFVKPETARPSALPKPSGLKPPSKIGRLCSNSAPKPAVPLSPRGDGGSSDTVRKLSDELSRKHLSDLIEDEEDEVTSTLPERPRTYRKASTSSNFSGTSMDALWEKHPRRLSEAGLRRSSDHSVVLTEDTDSFIIGDRVWVGGTKPGQIAYIGETQFAPGDWAGIVLDEPIGKNDGSVAGVRYFQCSERRGVFSRLTRLTRVPLLSHSLYGHDASPASDAGSVFERPPSGMARPRRTLSPNGSVRSAFSSKMNASISTAVSTPKGELCLGDRVIVSSSRGSKAGILRYVGNAEFAPGLWAGVELDDPVGKNDGSVDGKRYFDCSPRFGLFAPLSKVTRSPSNRKPGQCAIHNNNGRITPLRRSNSRDSLTSLGTSIASSRIGGARGGLSAQRLSGPRASSTPVSAKNAALQELLREKQSHLERLMKERDLERAEVAKITLQADRAENALGLAKKEADETISENAKLKAELDRIQQALEDERQKVEDLMFRNEEENINKEDYQKYKEAMEKEMEVRDLRIRELDAEVDLANARAQAAVAASTALDEQRSNDIVAITQQHREELTAAQTLSSELQKLLDEAYALLREKEYEKDSLNKSLSDELSKVRAESERALNEAKSKIAIAQTEFETQMSVVSGKLQLAESKLESEKANVERLNKENSQTVIELNGRLSQLQAALDDKTHELNKLTGSSKEHELNLSKEITKLKMELSAKILDLENLSEQHNKQNITYKTLEEELTRIKDEYKHKVDEYETILNEVSQQNDTNKTQLAELQQQLSAKTKDYERLLTDNSTSTASTEKLILEYKQTITERDKEIVKLKDEYEKATANFNINHSKIAEEHQKEIEERNIKIENLAKEIETYKCSLEQNTVDLESLRAKFTTNEDELKSLKAENDNLKKSIAELTQTISELKTKMSQMELEAGELKRLLEGSREKCKELQKAKAKAEEEYLNLTGQTTNSNDQFNQLSQLLKNTEQELQDIKDKYRDATNTHGRTEQELKQQLFRLQEDYSLERTQLLKSADETIEKLKTTENKSFELQAQLNDFKKLAEESQRNNEKLTEEKNSLRSEIGTLKTKEIELKAQHEQVCKRMESDIEKYKEEVSLLKAEGASSEVKLMEKVDQLIEAQNDLNNKLEEARRHEDALQKVIDDMTASLNNQKSQYDNEIVTLQTQLSNATEENSKVKAEESRLKELLQAKENSDKELTLKLEMLEVDMKSNIEVANEKDRQLAQLNEDLNQNIEMKKQIEDKLNNSLLEASNLRQQYDSLIANSSVEESLLKDQQMQLESVKKDISAVTQEKIAIESKYTAITKELMDLKDDHNKTLQTLQDIENSYKQLHNTLSEKDNLIKENAVLLQTETSKLKEIDSIVNNLKQELTIKTSEYTAKENELQKIKEVLESGSNESQQRVNVLQEELIKLNENHKQELQSLQSQCKVLQSQVAEQENQLQDLEKSKAKIVELQERLAKSENDIKQLSDINEGQKTNYEELNKQLQIQCDDYRRDCKKIKSEYKSRLSDLEKETQSYKDKIQSEVTKQEEMQKKHERQNIELSNKLELLTVQNDANVGNDVKLEQLTLELQSLRKSNAETLQNSEAAIHKFKLELETKVKELKDKENLLSKLQSELQNQRAKLEISEREKVLMQKDLSVRSTEVLVKDKNDNSTVGAAGDATKRSEDSEVIEGQVSFLNSVIVDMQRKNEKLLARVQALEGGSGLEEPPLFNGRKPRVIAPRLFCDICDVFDAHDTEDCPRQAQEDVQPTPKDGQRTPAPPPRAYCDICEVFGHSTENCDEEETF